MAKKQLTPEQIYNRNQKRAKILKIISPICFWGFLALSIVCLILAIRHSFGNVAEILELLDNKKYTGEQLEKNYSYLIKKYGELNIGNGGAGFQITFVNIGHALFSGIMITSSVLAVIFFVSAFLLGRWLLPKISAQILEGNQDMVNRTILKNNEK